MSTKTSLSRRSFLKSGLAGATVAAFPQILSSRAFGANSANNRLNIAIIGCGNRSVALIPPVLEEGHNLVAMCDVDPAAIAALKAREPNPRDRRAKKGGKPPAALSEGIAKAAVYDDFRRMLEREKSVDAVL